MNAATFVAITLSLVLAAATSGVATGSNTPSDRPAPPGHNLNHNQTFIHDTDHQTSTVESHWLSPEQAATVAPILIHFSHIGGGCSPIVCGSNHNETFLINAR